MTSLTIPAMAKRIELWPVEKLVPYERNARTHSTEQIGQLAASIVEFGFLNPILVDTSAGILAGHGRLAAAQQLGLAKVPVVVLDHLDERQRRAYVLADNKLAENAGWDLELLRQEISAMEIDPAVLGFGEDDLKRLHDGLELEAFEGMAEAGTERAEPEHQQGLGLPDGEDEDEAAAAWRGGVAAAVAVGRRAGAGVDRCDARAEPDGGVQGDAGHHGADALAGCGGVPTGLRSRVR